MGTAAELFRHHAFVDLETTGLDPSRDRVIEVGALFVHQGQVVQRISRLFGCSAPLPISIRRLTGIDDAALAGQPEFETFVPELRRALSGWTVVAHNASFEQCFLAELLEEIDAPVLDSCELLHYLYPELESYSLEAMIRWAGVGDRAAHRALKDCEDTLAMLCHAFDRCIDEGRAEDLAEVLECLAPRGTKAADDLPAQPGRPLVDLLSELALHCRSAAPSARTCEHGRTLDAATAASEVDRAPDPQMALWMEGALAREGISAVEPVCETAQPLAYVASSAAFAKKNGRPVAIAVGSHSRLARLLRRDLPALQRAAGDGLEYSFIAPQQHYLCRRRTLEVAKTDDQMSYEERAPRAYLKAFLRRSPRGESSRLSYWFKGRYPLLERLAFAARSEPATTLAERCPHYSRCFYHSAVARSKEADLLVMQQPLVAEWPPDYPRPSHLVIDEAHRLEGAISMALSRELSDLALARLSDRVLGVEGRGGLLAALETELLKVRSASAAALQICDGARRSRLLRLGGERLDSALSALFGSPGTTTVHRRELLLSADVQGGSDWAAVHAMLLELRTHLAELGAWLAALAETVPGLAESSPGLERDVFGAASEVQRLLRVAAEFAAPTVKGRCLYASLDASSNGWALRSEPLDSSEAFARLARERTVVLSSAALSVGSPNSWVLERLGVTSRLELGGPFPVEEQKRGRPLVLLVTDAPRPFDEAFLNWAVSRIWGIAAFLGGRVMGLFSSHLRLMEVEELLRPHLERSGIEMVRVPQARRNGARAADQAAGRVLLGSRSLWHRSEAEHNVPCVFIDKLPIEPLSRAAISAREAIASQCLTDARYRSMPYRLPRALVMLRQWLSTCAVPPDGRMVVVVAHPGAAQHRDALLGALEGYRSEVVPWRAARLRIYETLRPIAGGLGDARVRIGAANP
jgi:ATP-dependent DNA helicase DinG